jgi:hypothetical protein
MGGVAFQPLYFCPTDTHRSLFLINMLYAQSSITACDFGQLEE